MTKEYACSWLSLVLRMQVARSWWLFRGLAGPLAVAPGLVMVAGVGTGLAGPARDMLVKRAAPPGATGRVYGPVYSGLDIGFALSAPLFGLFLDHQWPAGVMLGAAALLGLALGSAQVVGRFSRR